MDYEKYWRKEYYKKENINLKNQTETLGVFPGCIFFYYINITCNFFCTSSSSSYNTQQTINISIYLYIFCTMYTMWGMCNNVFFLVFYKFMKCNSSNNWKYTFSWLNKNIIMIDVSEYFMQNNQGYTFFCWCFA